MASPRPIGIFDSGVGGLTVLREISRQLPYENIVYLGDTAHLPYGSKSDKTVLRLSLANTRFLVTKRIKLLVVACNTASSLSIGEIARMYELPAIGVIVPGVEKAIHATKNGCIGIIGTEATIRSCAYQREILARSKSIKILARPCPLFVPLVEEGWCNDKVTIEVAERYFAEFKKKHIDTLILGCTHYPLLKNIFHKVLGRNVALIDSAEEVAEKVTDIVFEKRLERKGTSPGYRHYFVTDLHNRFIRTGEFFLGERMKNVREINLERFYA